MAGAVCARCRAENVTAYGAAGTTATGPSPSVAPSSAAVSNRGSSSRCTDGIKLEERVGRLQEVGALGPVVHRDDPPGAEALRDIDGGGGADRRPVPDRDEQQVDRAERLGLLRPQLGLTEIAEVADPDAVEVEGEDRVRSALGPGRGVVFGGDGEHLADRGLETARRRAQDDRRAADRLDAVVIEMLVGDEQEVGIDAGDRRVVELQTRVTRQATCPRTGR